MHFINKHLLSKTRMGIVSSIVFNSTSRYRINFTTFVRWLYQLSPQRMIIDFSERICSGMKKTSTFKMNFYLKSEDSWHAELSKVIILFFTSNSLQLPRNTQKYGVCCLNICVWVCELLIENGFH